MKRLGETLAEARRDIANVKADPGTVTTAIEHLEDAGAQVGRLQVGCCAPNRLPLYVDLLEGLTTAQLEVNRSLGQSH